MKAITNPQFSIIVPTYNEKDNIALLIEKIHGVLSGRIDYEVIVVDDDSPDGTAAVAAALGQRYPVKVLVRKNIRGLASAVVHGINNSTSPGLVVIDADFQHPPALLIQLSEEINHGADIAIASRYISGGMSSEWGIKRNIISKIATIIAKIILPATRDIADPLSGYFAFNRKIIEGIELHPIGYKILIEILAVGHYSKIAEIPYTFTERKMGKTKVTARIILQYLQHLWLLALKNKEIFRVIRFILVGASGVVVNEGLLYILTNFAGLYYLVGSVIAVQCAILSNFFFNHFWTFRDRRTTGESILQRLGKFELVSIFGKSVNILVLYMGVTFLGTYYLVANLIGIAAGFLVNFLVNNIWTWRK